jgi:GntR family transcriptional regulator/MocR family aminotransferase
MPSGTLIPATRELVQVLGISRTTILNAYAELIAEGYVTGRVGSGTYVNGHVPDRIQQTSTLVIRESSTPAEPQRISAHHAVMPTPKTTPISMLRERLVPKPLFCDFQWNRASLEDFPFRVWYQLIAKYAPTDFKQNPSPEGSLSLREAIAVHLAASRGVVCNAEQILIGNGTQHCLDLVARSMLNGNDTVGIEEAHYSGVRETFQAASARLLSVPVDDEGLRVDELAKISKKARTKLVYVTPSHQMPTGATMSMFRRTQLIEWAARNDAYVLEDDYDGEYRYDGLPLPSLQGLSRGERVIYIGSFSRSISPTIRIGYLVAPRSLLGKLRDTAHHTGRHCPLLLQESLAEFIGEGHFERYLRRARGRNLRRRAALLDAIMEHFGDLVQVVGAEAGVHVMMRFRDEVPIDLQRFISRAAATGVGIYPTSPYFIRPEQRSELLLGYGSLEESVIRKGIRVLHSVFLDLTEQHRLARSIGAMRVRA